MITPITDAQAVMATEAGVITLLFHRGYQQ